jgi:hypothetical protein
VAHGGSPGAVGGSRWPRRGDETLGGEKSGLVATIVSKLAPETTELVIETYDVGFSLLQKPGRKAVGKYLRELGERHGGQRGAVVVVVVVVAVGYA